MANDATRKCNRIPGCEIPETPTTNILSWSFHPVHTASDCFYTFCAVLYRPLLLFNGHSLHTAAAETMSFSSLVQDIAYRDSKNEDAKSSISRPSHARSYNSTAATSVSIAGDIKSQLHAGYSHSLSRAWQAERQLTKVFLLASTLPTLLTSATGYAYLPPLYH